MSSAIKRINMMIGESNFGMYGKAKSKEWKKAREEVFDAKNDKELSDLLKKFTKMEKANKISSAELMDLVDKVDQKSIMLKKGR